MRKYYLFNINSNFKKVYKNNPYGLFKTIENLYNIKYIKYEVALFNDVCNLIDNSVIKYYIEHSYNYKKNMNKYLVDQFLVETNKSCIVVESIYNMPIIFMCLNIYSKNFLVVDFDNSDYFWLEDYI